MLHGWHQVAFDRDLNGSVVAVPGPFPLAVVRKADTVVVIEATCPHRGAHLGVGGQVRNHRIVCPFHGKHIAVAPAVDAWCVRGFETMLVGGLVFARFGGRDRGLAKRMAELDATHYIVPGFSMVVPAPASLVIENGFDAAHFRPVHRILNDPRLTVETPETGELHVTGSFVVPASPWQRSVPRGEAVTVPFRASAYSAGVVVAGFGGPDPYTVITTATPVSENECIVRLSVAVHPPSTGGAPDAERCRYLIEQSRLGIEADVGVWAHLSRVITERLDEDDEPVRAFRGFVRRCAEETK